MSKEETESVNIDLGEFSREELLKIISICHQKNCTFNEFFVSTLSELMTGGDAV